MDKTVYFLGAGATKDVAPNAPLNKDLVKKALQDFGQPREIDSLKVFIDILFHQRSEPVIDNQVWNLLDYIIQQGKSASKQYNLEQIIVLRKYLLNLVIKVFQKSLEHINVEIYDTFIDKIQNTDCAIISTNYDIVIDRAISEKRGLNYGTKARAMVMGEFEDESCLKRPGSYNPGITFNAGKIPLLKIHGSLNWLYCPKCDEIDITTDKGAVRTVEGFYYCFNRHCTNQYEPLLITPTMFKSYENRLIKEIWQCAERELVDAANLVFIGYALKDEDYQIRCLLMKALLNKSEPYKKIIVIEKKPKDATEEQYLAEVKKKYEDLYEHVDFRPIDFSGYVNSL